MSRMNRWAVVIDGQVSTFASRARAREAAGRHSRHPANVDIRRFGGYRNADGRARVHDLMDPASGRIRSIREVLREAEELGQW